MGEQSAMPQSVDPNANLKAVLPKPTDQALHAVRLLKNGSLPLLDLAHSANDHPIDAGSAELGKIERIGFLGDGIQSNGGGKAVHMLTSDNGFLHLLYKDAKGMSIDGAKNAFLSF